MLSRVSVESRSLSAKSYFRPMLNFLLDLKSILLNIGKHFCFPVRSRKKENGNFLCFPYFSPNPNGEFLPSYPENLGDWLMLPSKSMAWSPKRSDSWIKIKLIGHSFQGLMLRDDYLWSNSFRHSSCRNPTDAGQWKIKRLKKPRRDISSSLAELQSDPV